MANIVDTARKLTTEIVQKSSDVSREATAKKLLRSDFEGKVVELQNFANDAIRTVNGLAVYDNPDSKQTQQHERLARLTVLLVRMVGDLCDDSFEVFDGKKAEEELTESRAAVAKAAQNLLAHAESMK